MQIIPPVSRVTSWGPSCDYEHGSRRTAANMAFSSWEHLQWQFCLEYTHPPKNSVLLLNRERALTCVCYGEVHSARLWRLPDQCYTYLKSPKEKSLHAGFFLPYSFVSSQVCIRAECHSFLFYIQLLANYSHSFFLHLCPLDQSLVDLERWVISSIYIYQFIDLILISHLLSLGFVFLGLYLMTSSLKVTPFTRAYSGLFHKTHIWDMPQNNEKLLSIYF